MQHDVEDSELGFLVKERRKRSLSRLLEAQSRTRILKCTPREALIRAGRPFILPQERRTLETYQIQVRTCQTSRPYQI